jgi:hypothetical protein
MESNKKIKQTMKYLLYKRVGDTFKDEELIGKFDEFDIAYGMATSIYDDVRHEGVATMTTSFWMTDEAGYENPYKLRIIIQK